MLLPFSVKFHTDLNSILFTSLVIFHYLIATVTSCYDPLSNRIEPLISKATHKRLSHSLTIFCHQILICHLFLMRNFSTYLLNFHSLITKCPVHYSKLLYVARTRIFVSFTAHKADNIHYLYAYSQLINFSKSFDLLILFTICPLKLIKTLSKLFHHCSYFILISIANNLY